MKSIKRIEDKEIEILRSINNEYLKMKMELGDLEIKKHEVMSRLGDLAEKMSAYQKQMTDKYGEGTVINLQTGEIIKKEDGKN